MPDTNHSVSIWLADTVYTALRAGSSRSFSLCLWRPQPGGKMPKCLRIEVSEQEDAPGLLPPLPTSSDGLELLLF